MDKLKPCPFCGGEIDGPNFVQCNYGKKIITLGLTCKKCKTGFKFRAKFVEDPYTEAREAWNRRANDATVRHGHWIGEGDGYADGELVFDVWHCSECAYCIDDGTDDPERLPKYCPGCGALMDGGKENG